MERQGIIYEDGARGDQTKRQIYEDKAMGDRGILDVFISILIILVLYACL